MAEHQVVILVPDPSREAAGHLLGSNRTEDGDRLGVEIDRAPTVVRLRARCDRRLKAVVSVATGVNILEQLMGRDGMLAFLGCSTATTTAGSPPARPPPTCRRCPCRVRGASWRSRRPTSFHTDAQRTFAPTYDNRITMESVENLIADNSAANVHLIAPTALLMVHGQQDVVPVDAVRAVVDQAGEPKKLLVLDCLHTWVTQSADAAIEWFNRYLDDPGAAGPA